MSASLLCCNHGGNESKTKSDNRILCVASPLFGVFNFKAEPYLSPSHVSMSDPIAFCGGSFTMLWNGAGDVRDAHVLAVAEYVSENFLSSPPLSN